MRIAYLDCFSGISGDMFLGALVDASLAAHGASAESAVWDSWRREDGRWTVIVAPEGAAEPATFLYDAKGRYVLPADDAAHELIGDVALQSPDATVWAVDVNERALDLVRRNCQRLSISNVNAVVPDDVPAEVRFAQIVSNPPIRVGKAELHAMLGRWLPRLEPDGAAWLVVAKHLGAESLQRWIGTELGFTVERAANSKGFRVLEVRHADA